MGVTDTMVNKRTRGVRRALGLIAATALVTTAAACGGDSDSGDSDEPIKIGIAADLTGAFTLYGNSMLRSAQIAVDELNAAGGVLGRQIELVVEDTQTDVAVTTDKSRKLVESDKVSMVLGPIGSDAADAMFKTVAQDGKTILMYPETYEGGKCDPLFFSTGAVPAQQIRPMLPVLQEEFGPKVLLFGADYVWPRRSFEAAKPIIEEIGGELVAEVYLPLIADDFTELVNAVRDTQPDYIYTLYPAVWGAALKALEDAGVLEGVGVGTTFIGDPGLEGLSAGAVGTYTALPFFTVAEGPGVADFLAAFDAKYPGEIPSGGEGLGSYNAIKLWALAAEKAESTDPAKVAEAMVGISFESPTGTVTMEPTHHVTQTIQLAKVGADMKYELVQAFPNQPSEETCSL